MPRRVLTWWPVVAVFLLLWFVFSLPDLPTVVQAGGRAEHPILWAMGWLGQLGRGVAEQVLGGAVLLAIVCLGWWCRARGPVSLLAAFLALGAAELLAWLPHAALASDLGEGALPPAGYLLDWLVLGALLLVGYGASGLWALIRREPRS
jgi:hypothetical protein